MISVLFLKRVKSKSEIPLKGHIATAIVPTVFAGVHANFLLLVSAWFLWEQWKARHPAFWTATKENFLLPRLNEIKKYRDHLRDTLENIKESISRFYLSVLNLRDRIRASSSGPDIEVDIEKGKSQ